MKSGLIIGMTCPEENMDNFSSILLYQCIWNLAFGGSGLIKGGYILQWCIDTLMSLICITCSVYELNYFQKLAPPSGIAYRWPQLILAILIGHFNFLSFKGIWLMKVFTETCCAHYIRYQCIYSPACLKGHLYITNHSLFFLSLSIKGSLIFPINE